MTQQPTHHGYAVNVKDYSTAFPDQGPLTDAEVESIYVTHQERFWNDAAEIAHEHGFRDVYGEGRMGGYAVPQPQPHAEDMWADELAAWVVDRFRPFERDVLALMDEARADFLAELADAIDRAKREPAEAAYWAARDVVTV